MADSYEVTMMYRVHCPEGTEAAIKAVFDDPNVGPTRPVDEVLTELISEVMHAHQNAIDTIGGKHTSNWVYLNEGVEMWSEGWYDAENLPEEFGPMDQEELFEEVQNGHWGRMMITGVESSNMSWIWEQEEG
jgi:hypothetical protein